MTPTAIASTAEPISSSTNGMFDPASVMPRIATTLSAIDPLEARHDRRPKRVGDVPPRTRTR